MAECVYVHEKCGDIQAAAKLPQLRAREMEVVHRLSNSDFSFVNEIMKNFSLSSRLRLAFFHRALINWSTSQSSTARI